MTVDMKAAPARVAALVVTYNRRALLAECLRAILAQDVPVEAVVVVDNASTDGTGELFEPGAEFDLPVVGYHRMSENLGGAGGFKEGLRVARDSGCDWVWLMDDDCIARADTLSELVRASAIPDGRVSFLASSVFGPEGEPMNVPTVDLRPAENGYPDWYFNLDRGLVEIKSATFVSLLISVQAIREVGLPIGSFFIWGDDTEYTSRLTKYYGPAFFVGSSKMLHKRRNAKNLEILNEDNPARLVNFRRHTRNNLVVIKYYDTRRRLKISVLRNLWHSLTYRVKGSGSLRLRNLRANAVLLGTLDYLLHAYDIEDLTRIVDG